MDSMRSLNSSLPSSQPNRAAPPEELLQAFRTAALSVTNLYKSAATTQANARQAGYQEALEDLLQFLDKENLGLQDGEGWRVRQWATARYDGTDDTIDQNEEHERDEEQYDVDSENANDPHDGDAASDPQEQLENNPNASRHHSEDSDPAERPPVFHFSSNAQHDNNMQTDGSSSPRAVDDPSSSSNTPFRVEVLNRNGRPTSRSHQSRPNTHPNPHDFTFTAGTKRKLQFPDFFDISNWSDKRDGSGGGGGGSGPKRGRFV